MKKVITSLLLIYTIGLHAQDKSALKFAKTITESEMKEILTFIASDSLEGRETGERGQKIAAQYIADRFQEFGLEPVVETATGKSYFQPLSLQKASYNQVYLAKGDSRKENFKDFLYYSRSETYGEEFGKAIFTGFGDSTSLKGLDITGKFVAFVNKDYGSFRTTIKAMETSSAKGYFLILEDEKQFGYVMNRYGNYLGSPKMAFEFDQKGSKVFVIGKEMAEWLFGKPLSELKESGLGSEAEFLINVDMLISEVKTENVMGFLRGSEKPEEVLIISAHYDHVGIINGEIHNGADDDGSGTTTVLEIAEAFAKAAKAGSRPKRSILFLTVTGEEKGLLGSEYYSENPIFPIKNTVTNLNVDMVGRVDEKHASNPYYIYVIGADKLSQDLHQLSEKVNNTYTKLEFDYTYNAESDPNRYYYRSDHYNFAKKGIPVIFYFNGSHEDYHRPGDDVEKIHFAKMKKIADLIFFTGWEIVNREERIKLDSDK